MDTKNSLHPDAQFSTLGQKGEGLFERLRAYLELGEGFELFFCGFEAPALLMEVQRRLAVDPPTGTVFEDLTLRTLDALTTLPDRLRALHPAASGRKIVYVNAMMREEDLKGAWPNALRRFNERRNIVIRDCPNAVVLAGPGWLPSLAHDAAPDLWSVRTAVYEFPAPPPNQETTLLHDSVPWPSGLPMAHELQEPDYYEELAKALEGSRRPGEQMSRGKLLLYAAAAWQLRDNYEAALRMAKEANKAFTESHEAELAAVSAAYIADILHRRGEADKALHVLDSSAAACDQLGRTEHAAQVRSLQADIQENAAGGSP